MSQSIDLPKNLMAVNILTFGFNMKEITFVFIFGKKSKVYFCTVFSVCHTPIQCVYKCPLIAQHVAQIKYHQTGICCLVCWLGVLSDVDVLGTG